MKGIYSVFDRRAGLYASLITVSSYAEAFRSFAEVVRQPDSMLHKYPEDYDLHYLGDLDEVSGKIVPQKVPVECARALTVLAEVERSRSEAAESLEGPKRKRGSR